MNTLAIVSLISLLGWLILMIGTWRSHKVSQSGTIKMALVWVAIFLAVTLVMGMLTGS
ncbi:hypothetical protein [Croceicoccus mobilis]|uniref:Uncharacterized protein n=1 Tax=Croceicoccus mobilis TaxID=1703339 RepID=A0A916Z5K2_9SPHN|nr:hypothetical protein [Croceicoccus mobilis]GGD75701.1 hypothetical protein GCM10010990_26610 [Croceicoccus mobilis]